MPHTTNKEEVRGVFDDSLYHGYEVKKILHQELQKARETLLDELLDYAHYGANDLEDMRVYLKKTHSELHQDNRNTMLDITNLTGKEIFQSNDSELHQDNK